MGFSMGFPNIIFAKFSVYKKALNSSVSSQFSMEKDHIVKFLKNGGGFLQNLVLLAMEVKQDDSRVALSPCASPAPGSA